MTEPLTISARNAGQVALKKYCPRCAWYLLRLKRFPFQMGMPGIMFYLEQCEKAFILGHLAEHRCLPDSFGPFADCTEPVEFPFRMTAMHNETGVRVTAQADLMLRNPDKSIALIDLKTALAEGGGKEFLPQYEIQVIGYSWVAEETNVGDVGSAGLIYCEIQKEAFKDDPMEFTTETGIIVPFSFTPHPVELDFSRFTKCLREMNRIWHLPRPPKGAEDCKDCILLNRLFDFEDDLRTQDTLQLRISPRYRDTVITIEYLRNLARGTPHRLKLILDQAEISFDESGMWALWDFS